MAIDTENLEDRIDRDRRQRESALFAFLLSLFAKARDHVYAALRVGASPFDAARDVLIGNPQLALPGGARTLAGHLIAADVAGYRRTTLVVPPPAGVAKTVPLSYAPAADYSSVARQNMGQMLGTLNRRIMPALREPVQKQRNAVREAFVGGGYVESATSKAWLLESTAVTLTGFAYNGGYFNGWQRPEARERLRGFRYSATLDSRTTNICRAYDGVKLPVDHPWWQTHWPLCHFNCRSVAVPITREFVQTPEDEIPWTPWPMPGFGHAPALSIGLGRAA